jgi:chromosome segregation ATPase
MFAPLKLVPRLSVLLLLVVGAGCTAPQAKPQAPVAEAAPQADATESSAQRFQDTPLEGRTAVESAIELSEKYARLSDQTVSLREENQRLVTENESLKQQITSLEAKLQQTQKELGEANNLLMEMLNEINNWRTNVLGFRSEMREAAKAQLEALLKVLEILGGEAEAGTLGRQHAATLSPQSYDIQEPNQSLTSSSGEPNELK